MATKLIRFSRNRLTKLTAVILFLLCVASICYFTLKTVESSYDEINDIYFDDLFPVRADYLQSSSFARHMLEYTSGLLNASGWYAETEEEWQSSTQNGKKELAGYQGFDYYIKTEYGVFTNLPEGSQNREYFRGSKAYLICDSSSFDFNYRYYLWYQDLNSHYYNEVYTAWDEYLGRESIPEREDDVFYLSMNASAYAQAEAEYNLLIDGTVSYVWPIIVCALIVLFLFFYLSAAAGRRPDSGEVHLNIFDRVYADVSLAVGILIDTGIGAYIVALADRTGEKVFNYIPHISFLGVLAAAVALWWWLSFIRLCKARRFPRHTLIISIICWFFRPVGRLFRWFGSLCSTQAYFMLIMGGFGLTLTFFGTIFASAYEPGGFFIFGIMLTGVVAALAGWRTVHFVNLQKGLRRMSEGKLDEPVPEKGPAFIRRMARDVNSASEGLRAAVDSEVKSRMFKTELITNVSHDLRTPLTSVITYADLLKTEGLNSPDAKKYLDIITGKAKRLQALTDDLFEASKAASGDMKVNLQSLDLHELVTQTLGELNERLNASGLDIRYKGKTTHAICDGRMMWRVLENLIGNIAKYSMPNTRVYIELDKNNSHVRLTLRNISAQPLEKDSDYLTERFTRGDDARSTEGSGLGLAIVKSFMDLQHGSFSLFTDGDLFKAELSLLASAPDEAKVFAPIIYQ